MRRLPHIICRFIYYSWATSNLQHADITFLLKQFTTAVNCVVVRWVLSTTPTKLADLAYSNYITKKYIFPVPKAIFTEYDSLKNGRYFPDNFRCWFTKTVTFRICLSNVTEWLTVHVFVLFHRIYGTIYFFYNRPIYSEVFYTLFLCVPIL